MQLVYRGVCYLPTSSSTQNNLQLSYRGVSYSPMSSKAIGEVTNQKLSYRGISYYCAKSVGNL